MALEEEGRRRRRSYMQSWIVDPVLWDPWLPAAME
ncbi:hypothetical protein ACP70R_033272 [Stipagrostis hirtigluma subsp. patula]